MWTAISEFINGKISFEEANKKLVGDIENHIIQAIKATLYNIDCLDKYDFSEFLTEGRSLNNIIEVIEDKYDKEFYQKYGMYMFDNLSIDEIYDYFKSRYNIHFQEYIDWVVRHDDGTYAKTRKRIKDCS